MLPRGAEDGAQPPGGPQPSESQVPEPPPSTKEGLSTTLNILLLLTVLSLAPAILLLCTCFTRVIIVLGLMVYQGTRWWRARRRNATPP